MNMTATADFILSAFGTKYHDSEQEYHEALVGAMILADGLLELTRIKKILLEALKNK